MSRWALGQPPLGLVQGSLSARGRNALPPWSLRRTQTSALTSTAYHKVRAEITPIHFQLAQALSQVPFCGDSLREEHFSASSGSQSVRLHFCQGPLDSDKGLFAHNHSASGIAAIAVHWSSSEASRRQWCCWGKGYFLTAGREQRPTEKRVHGGCDVGI